MKEYAGILLNPRKTGNGLARIVSIIVKRVIKHTQVRVGVSAIGTHPATGLYGPTQPITTSAGNSQEKRLLTRWTTPSHLILAPQKKSLNPHPRKRLYVAQSVVGNT